MNNTLKIVFALFFGWNSFISEAQDLHIYYDAHSKNLTYLYKGDTIWTPKVRKGAQVFLHVENFNNFLYKAKVAVDNEVLVSSSSGNPLNGLMSGGSGGIASLFGGLNPIQKIAEGGLDNTENMDFSISGFGADTDALKTLSTLQRRFESSLKKIFKIEKKINFVNEDVDTYLEGQAVNSIVRTELENLKRNPRLQPQQIKTLSLEYLQKIFPSDGSEEVTLTTLLEKSNSKKELKGYLGKLQEAETDYHTNSKELSLISAELAALSLVDNDFKKFKSEVTTISTKSQKVKETISENKTQLKTLIANAQDEDIQNLTALRYEYEAISANDFSETFRMEAAGDHTVLNLTFTEKATQENTEKTNSFSIPPIKVSVFGGMKINAGVGVSFGGFVNQPQSFFIKDSLIISESNDSFSPLLTSFIHFYSQSSKQVSFGGSLGIGIPIVSTDKQSVSFLFGPSLIIGRGERIVFSGGLMGSKVERLSNGYKIGDEFELSTDNIPKKSIYELGYFLGLSFNLNASK